MTINQYRLPYLSPADVQSIRSRWQSKKTRSGKPQLKDLAEEYQRSPHTIRNIIRGKNYSHEQAP